MPRKRKLTATFCEIQQDRDAMRRSWRGGEHHSDWTLALGAEEYKIHKVIVATGPRASAFLAASFREHCGGKSARTDLTELVPRPCWPHLEALLDFIYDGDIAVSVDSWGPLVKMADLLQIGALYTKCVELGSDLITHRTAPKMASDAVGLELGGELQQEVVQICVDAMAPQFSSYEPKDLAGMPLQVFQSLMRRDDLEVTNEDQVFDFLLRVSPELDKADMTQLWQTCRLHLISPERVLEVALVQEIPKEALVWALAQRGAPSAPRAPPWPDWVAGWAANSGGPRGRVIWFAVQNPTGYAGKKSIRSPVHRLCDRFRWRLLVFPLGTDSTGNPKQVAAFVEIVPDADVAPSWRLKQVKYSITVVNWVDDRRSVTKEHVFDFCAAEIDNGWHRGWVTPDVMTTNEGWLNEAGELAFHASCDVKGAVAIDVDPGD